MNCCRAFAHAAPTRETDLPIKFHDKNTPALPAAGKGQSGKVLLCPQQDYPATSVANFCTAVLRYFIFLIGPQSYIQELGPYYAPHLMGFLQAIYGGAGRLRVIAEEFTNAPLKTLTESLTTLRGFGAEVHMVAQSRSEIERRFGRLGTQTIEENSIVKQWFGFSSVDEAERVSRAMGEQLAVGASLGADTESLRLNTNMSLQRQRWMSPSELMAMPADQQLIHVKGLGFFVARKIGQQQIAPYCHLVTENPIEGGRLAPDPKLTLTTPNRRPT